MMRSAAIGILLASVTASPALALAQDKIPEGTKAASGAPAAPDQASWTADDTADDIVVTARREGYAAPNSGSATRTNTPLIRTPQSVQVINKTLLVEQDRRTLAEALVNVSGVTPVRSEEVLFTSPIVRGFPSEIYQDGLPFYGATTTANDPTSLVGVERIDVVKGPVSTLYAGGVGTPLGGLINIEAVRPYDTLGGYVAFRAGSFGTVNPYADVNVPLASGIAARITGEYQRNDSWVDRVEGNRWSIQPSISFQLGPRTDLFVQGQINRRSQLEYSGIPAAQALAGQIDRNVFPGAPNGQPNTVINNKLATAILRHCFSDTVKLTVSGRYYHSDTDEYGSFVLGDFFSPDPATPTTYPIFPIFLTGRTREATVDANLQASVDVLGGQHELLVGVNYDRTRFFSGLGFDFVPVGNLDLANPSYSLAYGTPPAIPTTPTLGGTQTDRYETVAGYIQDQATYGPLHLTGSLRFTRLRFRELEQGSDLTFNRVSPRIGATLDVVPGVAVYAAYATAFRGAFGVVSATTPKPETSRNIEGGVKLALPKAHLSGTIAVFDQTRQNVAAPDPNDIHFSIQVGEQRARGVEADLTWKPTPAFSLLATYAHTNAEVTKTTIESGIPLGDRLPRVPRDSGRIAARYRVLDGPAKGLSFGAGLTAFSARDVTLPNSVSVPGYAALDAQAAYDFSRFTIAVSAVNLGGSRAFDTYQYLSFPVVIPTQPRSALVTLKARL
jgi:iron complex outermembrane receptor protein